MEIRVQPTSQADWRDEESLAASQVVKHSLWLSVLVLAGIFPFASRAIFTDEPQYLHVATAAVEHSWLFPQGTPWIFFGKRYANLAAQTHLPVVEYYLAMLLKLLGGFNETAFRLLFAIFPLLAVLSFYQLSRRFTSNPLPVSALFAVSPAFFVLSPALMMDIPALAFVLAGLSVYFNADRWLWVCSICFILAAGTAYTALIPIGCLLVWAVAARRPSREWLAIAAAPATICVWMVILRIHFGQSPATELLRYYTLHFSFSEVFLPLFSFTGAVSLFPWTFLALAGGSKGKAISLLSVSGALLLTCLHTWSSFSYRLWFVLLASSGIGFLLLFIWKAISTHSRRRADRGYGFLLLWLPATLLFLLLFAEMISARYILLSLPPLFLVSFDRIRRDAAGVVIASTLILSIALAVADYRLVGSYPRWITEEIVPLQQQGFHVWNAAESGLRFYLSKEGIETLEDSDLRPGGGNLIVRQTSFRYSLSKELEPLLVTILQRDLQDDYPIRTFSRDGQAGFHDSHFGVVPFTVSRAPLDRLEIAEVSPFAVHLPQTVPGDFSSVPVWFPGGVLLKQIQPEMKFTIPVPPDAKALYELEGKGTVALSTDGILLRKENPGPAVWKNFRIVPHSWPAR